MRNASIILVMLLLCQAAIAQTITKQVIGASGKTLPGGFRSFFGSFGSIGDYGFWWSSSAYGATNARGHYLYFNSGYVLNGYNDKKDGRSMRCLRD